MDYLKLNQITPIDATSLNVVPLLEQINIDFGMWCKALTDIYILFYTHQKGESVKVCIHKEWIIVYTVTTLP